MAKKKNAAPGARRERLIKTKLNPPGALRRVIPRERLRDLIGAGPDRHKLILVTAPAGYGKSTLLTQWANRLEQNGSATGWVSLDPDDNDPIRFLTYVIGALGAVLDAGETGTLTRDVIGWRFVVQPLLMALAQELQEFDGPFALFLDDYDRVTDPAVHEALDWLIQHSPPQMTFIVASRTESPLSTSSLRLRGQLLELRIEDLSFALAEAEQFLNDLKGHALERQQLTGLVERTEGWVAGLSLVSLALDATQDRDRFLAEFSGSDRAVTDYLGETVLDRLSPERRDFLLVTSVLDRMCADLCREITGYPGCQQLLEQIEAANLFLLPLDREHTWYRYHHLFADFLRTRLAAEQPERVRACYQTASDWSAARGYDSEAIRYAFQAEDFARVADLIEGAWEDLVQYRGEHATLLDWMRRLPARCLDERPWLRIAHAWSLTFTRQYAAAEGELEKFDARGKTRHMAAAPRGLSAVETIRCVLYAMSDQTARCWSASNEWLERWNAAPWFEIGTVSSTLAYACVARREFERGRAAIERARHAFEHCHGYYGMAWDDAIEGLFLIQEGRPREATTVYRRGLASAENRLGPGSYAGSLLSILLAEALYEQNALGEAKVHLEAGFPLIDDHGVAETALAGYVTRARLLCEQGHPKEMDRWLIQGERLGQRLGMLRLSVALAAERITLSLRCGLTEKAHTLAETAGFLVPEAQQSWAGGTDTEALREFVHYVRAQLWIADGDTERATRALGTLATRARKRGWNRRLLELLVTRAIAFAAGGNRPSALRTLDGAVRLAAIGGSLRVFLDAGPLLAELLAEMAAIRPVVPGEDELAVHRHLKKLTQNDTREKRRQAAPATARTATADGGAGDALTRRETEILRLLAKGLSNQDLAKTLFVSETTVKWHLSNLYAKLGVRNRTSAVGHARQHSLIQEN